MDGLHLAVDAIGAKYGGSSTGLLEILEAALNDKRISKVTLFSAPPGKRLFVTPVSDKLVVLPKPWIEVSYILRLWWYECQLAVECRRIGADVLLVQANFGRSRFDIPHVTYVRQSLPFLNEAASTFKSAFVRFKIWNYYWMMKRSCKSASLVLSQSGVMKQSLVRHFGLDPAKVIVILGAPKQFDSAKIHPLMNNQSWSNTIPPRILYVGMDAPYKMLDTLVDGLKLLRKKIPDSQITMTLSSTHRYNNIEGISCVGYLNDNDLVRHYLNSDILVLPSLAESGPQPPMEAMSLGVPVLIADRPYARDLFEDSALFFDPLSSQDFAEKAIRLLGDQELRQQLIESGYELIEKRRSSKPYQEIIDICVKVALTRTASVHL